MLAGRPRLTRLAASLTRLKSTSVTAQLDRVAELQRRASAVNSPTDKARVIAEYPDLRELLEYIYQPNLKLHLTPASLRKYAAQDGAVAGEATDGVIELFDMLANKSVTGNEAKKTVLGFLKDSGIKLDDERGETFCRLLERNLVAGFGARTLKTVHWGEDAPTSGNREATKTAKKENTETTLPSPRPAAAFDRFSVALGKTITPPFRELFKSPSKWYASRKLDGVRCITFIDFLLPPPSAASSSSSTSPPSIVDIRFLSRTGNEFTSLTRLAAELRPLASLPQLQAWLDRDAPLSESADGTMKRLVLDGEVCVMRPLTDEEKRARQPRDDGSSAEWDDEWAEDFTAAVSEVRRKTAQVERPAYFLIDVLSWRAFSAGESVQDTGLGKTFGQRIQDIQAVADHLTGGLVRAVAQRQIDKREDVEEMVDRAAREGWEGIILRADRPYKGKRSSDVYKFKKWLDAEYTVKSIDTSTMRLAVNGVYGEHLACSNVWIEHDGHPVSVGSGFSADQRLRYARDPDLIVGKQITVEYFAESQAGDRDKGLSLRFPRVKHVWEEGLRAI